MNIAVYCGANLGSKAEYVEAARELGAWIGQSGHRLIYGGGRYGMMGVVADAVLENGGEAIGVTPPFFIDSGLIHESLTEVRLVADMPERRKTMIELSEMFIALPGGIGTLDEISEVMTYDSLSEFMGGSKQAVLYNTRGYYDKFVDFLKHMVKEGYYEQSNLDAVLVADNVEELETAVKKIEG